MREGHALPSDGSGGQSFPLSHRPLPLLFSDLVPVGKKKDIFKTGFTEDGPASKRVCEI